MKLKAIILLICLVAYAGEVFAIRVYADCSITTSAGKSRKGCCMKMRMHNQLMGGTGNAKSNNQKPCEKEKCIDCPLLLSVVMTPVFKTNTPAPNFLSKKFLIYSLSYIKGFPTGVFKPPNA